MLSVGKLRYIEAAPAGDAQALRPRGTLVLIHAFPLNARMWTDQQSLADLGWRVIAPQLRGFDGDTVEPGQSVDDYAGDVIDLLDGLHIQEAVIGGLSLGGYVTLAIFRHAPRYFRAMILADTRAEADTPEGVANRQKMLALVRDKGPEAIADEMVPKLLGDTARHEAPELSGRLRDLILASSTEAIAGAVTAMMTRPDSTPLLASIHCPTLIVVGEEDRLTPPPLSEAMHQAIAGSELVTIPRAGHVANIEQPPAFNAALSRFLTHRV
jgi:pimeloyl-ACP methyl ester carboxylesterase